MENDASRIKTRYSQKLMIGFSLFDIVVVNCSKDAQQHTGTSENRIPRK